MPSFSRPQYGRRSTASLGLMRRVFASYRRPAHHFKIFHSPSRPTCWRTVALPSTALFTITAVIRTTRLNRAEKYLRPRMSIGNVWLLRVDAENSIRSRRCFLIWNTPPINGTICASEHRNDRSFWITGETSGAIFLVKGSDSAASSIACMLGCF